MHRVGIIIYTIYITPNLRLGITVFNPEKEYGGLRESTEGVGHGESNWGALRYSAGA